METRTLHPATKRWVAVWTVLLAVNAAALAMDALEAEWLQMAIDTAAVALSAHMIRDELSGDSHRWNHRDSGALDVACYVGYMALGFGLCLLTRSWSWPLRVAVLGAWALLFHTAVVVGCGLIRAYRAYQEATE